MINKSPFSLMASGGVDVQLKHTLKLFFIGKGITVKKIISTSQGFYLFYNVINWLYSILFIVQ